MNTQRWTPKGIFHDVLRQADGRATDFGWRSNLVVDRCRVLLAAFMKGDGPLGIRLLRIGRGLAAWDANPPVGPQPADQQLVDPNPFDILIQPNQIVYLDAVGQPSVAPTSRVQVTVDLGPGMPPLNGQPDYPLREFGLFGQFNSQDYMIDYVRHAVIHKAAADTLTRTIQLAF